MDKIQTFKNQIEDSKKIVFFGGAGVSTASGIPDFRSSNGIYNTATGYKATGEEILSIPFFNKDPKTFFEFSFNEMYFPEIKPSTSHIFLSKLENEYNKDVTIVTQNIDGLHQKAGSKKVYELHGTQATAHCTQCGEKYDGDEIFNLLNEDRIPICKKCGGIVRHDVVLFGQSLPREALFNSINAIENADMLIIAGTSLNVYPAAGLIDYFRGKYVVVLNKEKLHIRLNNYLEFIGDMNDVFKKLLEIM